MEKQTGVVGGLCVVFGFVEFLFRFILFLVIVCTLVGGLILLMDLTDGRYSSHATETLLTPYLWKKI